MAVNVETRKNGSTVVYAVYQGPNGKRRKEQVKVLAKGTSKRDVTRAKDRARDYANAQRCAVKSGEWKGTKQDRERARKAATVGKALQEYVAVRGGSTFLEGKAATLSEYLAKHRKRVQSLADVTAADAEAFRAHRSGKVGASTLRKDLIFARSVFRWARDRKLVPGDCDPFGNVRLPKEPAPRDYYLDAATEAKLLKTIRMPWLRAVVVWMIGTGMDRGEVCALRWSSVKLTDNYVDAPRLKTGTARKVQLTPALRAVLTRAKKLRNTTGLVFLDDDGQPIKPDRISQALKRTYKRAGLPIPKGGPVKIMRHTFATRVQRATGDLRITQRLCGHTNPSTTARYAHVTDEQLRDAVLAAFQDGS